MDKLQAGYAAHEKGKPFDELQSTEWQDGWKTASDFAEWKRIAASLGAEISGFDDDRAATLVFPNGETHKLAGALLDAVERLRAKAAGGRDE